MKTYKLSGKPLSRGYYSRYYLLSAKIGLKVITLGTWGDYESKVKTNSALYRTNIWREAKLEFNLLKKAYARCKLFPKPHDLCVGKLNGQLYPVIKMEHIAGPLLFKAKGLREKHLLQADLEEHLNSIGVHHYDLHENNIIVAQQKGNKVKLRPIDCTPEHFSVSTSRASRINKLPRLELWID